MGEVVCVSWTPEHTWLLLRKPKDSGVCRYDQQGSHAWLEIRIAEVSQRSGKPPKGLAKVWGLGNKGSCNWEREVHSSTTCLSCPLREVEMVLYS